MNVEEDEIYTDLEYGCDLIVKGIMDSVVLMEELKTGDSRIYGREEFSSGSKRFVQKHD